MMTMTAMVAVVAKRAAGREDEELSSFAGDGGCYMYAFCVP